jgi:hypothetical protein
MQPKGRKGLSPNLNRQAVQAQSDKKTNHPVFGLIV